MNNVYPSCLSLLVWLFYVGTYRLQQNNVSRNCTENAEREREGLHSGWCKVASFVFNAGEWPRVSVFFNIIHRISYLLVVSSWSQNIILGDAASYSLFRNPTIAEIGMTKVSPTLMSPEHKKVRHFHDQYKTKTKQDINLEQKIWSKSNRNGNKLSRELHIQQK